MDLALGKVASDIGSGVGTGDVVLVVADAQLSETFCDLINSPLLNSLALVWLGALFPKRKGGRVRRV